MSDFETMPHDADAERIVLGAQILDPTVIDALAVLCPPEVFHSPVHGMLAAVLADLRNDGRDTGPVAVLDELRTRGLAGRISGTQLLDLQRAVPNTAMAGYYADIIRRHAELRRLAATGTRLHQMGMNPGTDLDDVPDLYAAAIAELSGAMEAVPATTVPTVADLLAPTLDGIEKPRTDVRVPIGIHDLDALLGGWEPGRLYIVAARPAVGKSVLALGAARHAAIRAGVPTLFATLEMGSDEVMRRLISAEAKVMYHHIEANNLSDDEWARIAGVAGRIAEAPLYIDDSSGTGLGQLRQTVALLKRTKGLGLVIVDYLQLMPTSKGPSRQELVGELSRGLKLMAKEFHVPIIALSQLNRGPEQRADKRPAMSDLRESGSLEQDPDVVILLHREDAYVRESARAGEVDLIVAKNRSGPMATVTAAFLGHYAQIADMAWSPSSSLRNAA